jgi:hypothetical protein
MTIEELDERKAFIDHAAILIAAANRATYDAVEFDNGQYDDIAEDAYTQAAALLKVRDQVHSAPDETEEEHRAA